MRNIAIITGNRAEYGLLKNIMKKVKEDKELKLQLIVTGAHLSINYGLTVSEIEEDGFFIDARCPILMSYEGRDKNAREISLAINEFVNVFNRLQPDIIVILGDRYEILAAAITAMTMNIPIAHICGGEITEGAMDEQIRHSITKLANLHFTGADVYKENVLRMGEEEWRVFDVGELGIENIKNTNILSREELSKSLNFEISEDTILATYHPVTLEINHIEKQIKDFTLALEIIDKDIIITYPNSDNGSEIIIEELEKFAANNLKVHLFKSLGSIRYIAAMKYCGAIVGNSSSAIIEGAFLRKPVVNIGNRQKGRMMAENIINVDCELNSIINGINKALSIEFKKYCINVKSLYGEGDTSEQILSILKNIDINERLLKKKLIWR